MGQISTTGRQWRVLIPDIKPAMLHFSPDAKSVPYLDASRGETIIYRQPWRAGKVSSSVQVVLKIPFAFRQLYSGNAYDFSKDPSTIVYTRPGGQADLYLLTEK